MSRCGEETFALSFIWALLAGHSTVIVVFLVLELVFLVAQARGVTQALRADPEAGRATTSRVERASRHEPELPLAPESRAAS